MPSSGNDTGPLSLQGAVQVRETALKWLERSGREHGADACLAVLASLSRTATALRAGLPFEGARSAMRNLRRRLDPTILRHIPEADTPGPELATELELAGWIELDRFMTTSPVFRKRYLRLAYKKVDQALRYNTTTDPARLVPALAWVRQTLQKEARTGCAFVDVGCAAEVGAPGLRLAASILRPDNVCATIHGTDIRVPPRKTVMELFRRQRVWIYACNPVMRPLPRAYDAALLANVHRHLDRASQELLLANLGASLTQGGLLFINWRFSAKFSPGLCLTRQGNAMVLVGECNLV